MSKRQKTPEKREPILFSGKNLKQNKPVRRRRSFTRLFLKFTFFSILWGAVALSGLFGYIWLTLDQKGLFHVPNQQPGIMVLASDGSALAEQGAFFGDEVLLNELPDYVPNAVIAIEDQRFHSHYGFDPIGLVRAALANARAGKVVQGGSTITQQLAKNLFLKADRTYERKLQEVVLALWLESKYSKDEILQLYLNRVYYGAGATGIEKAAQAYYAKSARELTLIEAATLAGVLKAPTTYSPANHPEAAEARARLVIGRMQALDFITEREERAAKEAAKVAASDYVPSTRYIVDWVNEQLPQLVKNYSESIIIETTIDASLQNFAEKALRNRLNVDGAKLNVSQGALVVMDTTGAIRTLVGGKSYKRSQFNRVTKAKRQPGSAFKPFVYLAAIEQGYAPDSVEVDEPVRIGDWTPENYKQKYMGAVTLKKALALSLNTIAVKLVSYVGPETVTSVAHRLGITSELGINATIALGTSEVTLLELTSAFVPFANGGAPVSPFTITRISTRDGKTLYERQGDGFNVTINGYDLGAMNEMLRGVVTSGTARRAQFGDFEIAGKTGTSQDYRDAWFLGYTAQYVGGVWVGNDNNAPTKKVTGGSIPTAIWKDVMEQAHSGLEPQPLPGYSGERLVSGLENTEEIDSSRMERRRRSRGFFEHIGSLFGNDEEEEFQEPPPRRKKRKTAFEMMQENAEE